MLNFEFVLLFVSLFIYLFSHVCVFVYLVDRRVVPLEVSSSLFTEKLIVLPHVYQSNHMPVHSLTHPCLLSSLCRSRIQGRDRDRGVDSGGGGSSQIWEEAIKKDTDTIKHKKDR